MEPKDYLMIRIEGEYAILKPLTKQDDTEVFIALALLPAGADIGMKLRCVDFQYTILDER